MDGYYCKTNINVAGTSICQKVTSKGWTKRCFSAPVCSFAVNITLIHRIIWPNFTWDSDALSPVLSALRYREGQLVGRMQSLGFDFQQEASLKTLTDDVVKSSAIEGVNLNAEEVRSSIARRLGMNVGGLIPSSRDVEGIVEVMLDATQKFADPLTDIRLFDWYAALFPTGRSGMQKITVGGWRRPAEAGAMQVVSGPYGREKVHFVAPAAERLGGEMTRFLDWFNKPSTTYPALKAARNGFTACRHKSRKSGKPIMTNSKRNSVAPLTSRHG